ncbi:MAG: hypothetical protein M0Z50_03535 [Planctomycetia bacterium]|nr:hypothetical protein [Planctomycetia bacterium]
MEKNHQPNVEPPPPVKNNSGRHGRRSFLWGGLLALLGTLRTGQHPVAAAEADHSGPPALVTEGESLKTVVRQGQVQNVPLDTMVLFERGDNHHGRAETHEVLSLIHEEKGPNSYPWTLYAQLTSHQMVGDAVALCSRLIKKGAGWAAGHHSEVFTHARGVAIGVNVEMHNLCADPRATEVIGMNIQPSQGLSRYGIQIQGGAGNANQFEKAIGLNGGGAVGVDLAGHFQEVGIHAHDNSIRVNEGASLELDGLGKIRLRYRKGRIEFMNGDHCIGHINTDGADHEL